MRRLKSRVRAFSFNKKPDLSVSASRLRSSYHTRNYSDVNIKLANQQLVKDLEERILNQRNDIEYQSFLASTINDRIENASFAYRSIKDELQQAYQEISSLQATVKELQEVRTALQRENLSMKSDIYLSKTKLKNIEDLHLEEVKKLKAEIQHLKSDIRNYRIAIDNSLGKKLKNINDMDQKMTKLKTKAKNAIQAMQKAQLQYNKKNIECLQKDKLIKEIKGKNKFMLSLIKVQKEKKADTFNSIPTQLGSNTNVAGIPTLLLSTIDQTMLPSISRSYSQNLQPQGEQQIEFDSISYIKEGSQIFDSESDISFQLPEGEIEQLYRDSDQIDKEPDSDIRDDEIRVLKQHWNIQKREFLTKITKLQNQVKDSGLKFKVKDLKMKLIVADQDLKDKNLEIIRINRDLNKAREDLRTSHKEINDLKLALQQKQNKATEKLIALLPLEIRKDARKAVYDFQEKAFEFVDNINGLSQQLEHFRNENRRLKAIIAQTESKEAILFSYIDELSKGKEQLRDVIDQMNKGTVENLRNHLYGLKQKSKAQEETISRLKEILNERVKVNENSATDAENL